MKKLMIAVSAALCATVGFSDVTSANIVGYLNADAQKGVTTMGTMFMGVGNQTISIQDMIPTKKDSNKPDEGGRVYIQTLTEAKAENEKFVWMKDDFVTPPLPLKWYNKDKSTPATKVFNPGEGFFFNANKDIYLNVSGEVLTTNVLVTAVKGVTVLNNPYAVDLPIANILPTKKSKAVDEGGRVYIQTLTEAKAEKEKFVWMKDEFVTPPLPLKWYNKDKSTPATKSFAPGEGFFFNSNNEIYVGLTAPAL